MPQPLTVREMIAKRAELETRILDHIRKFESETACTVQAINLLRDDTTIGSGTGRTVFVQVQVYV